MMDKHSQPEGESDLLSCPFCGLAPSSQWNSASPPDDDCGYWAIECCRVFVHEDNEKMAAARWNTRAPHQSGGVQTVDLTNHHNALKCPYCNPDDAVRKAVIEECVRCLEALGARYHSGRDLVAHLRACASTLPSAQSKTAIIEPIESVGLRGANKQAHAEHASMMPSTEGK